MSRFWRNFANAALCVLVPAPSVMALLLLRARCVSVSILDAGPDAEALLVSFDKLSWTEVIFPFLDGDAFCTVGLFHPLLFANLLFFYNVCVLFWIISLLQKSTWLIDPYWTILPVLLGHFYQYHPFARTDDTRSMLAIALIWIWSVRLTHSYFRREEWQFGEREDWRFAEYRSKHGRHFWWTSFFVAYLSQQAMLIGVSLPLLAVHQSEAAIWWLDWVAVAGAVLGLSFAYVADTQLRSFMLSNERRRSDGRPVVQLLNTGLWYYSRHPNYFGEQVWWWSFGLLAVSVGQPWMLCGAFLNSIVLAVTTKLTEGRMLARKERRQLYAEYCRRTSMWVPLPKFVNTN